jgi:hypothetical protein
VSTLVIVVGAGAGGAALALLAWWVARQVKRRRG